MTATTPEAPLADVVVVELGHSVAAPFAGQVLGDLGAQVFKIEKAGGDDARKWGPPFVDGMSATFQSLNRNKHSSVVDLRDPQQLAQLADFIVTHADVVIQNMRPGQVDALGLDATTLRERNPRLVYCNLGAFGTPGPLAARPGYDPLMQAFGGIMSVVGEEGRPPVRVGPSIIDMGTGMWAVIGIVCALMRRRDTGTGAVIDVSLFETATSWMTMYAAQYLASGELPRRNGSGQAGIVPYRAFSTADGDLVVAAGNDALYRRLCEALGEPAWADDARFASNPLRVQHVDVLHALLEPKFAARSSAEWIERLDAAGIPCAPVQNVAATLRHPQTEALGIVQGVSGSSIPVIGLPIRFDGRRATPRHSAPALNADGLAALARDPRKPSKSAKKGPD